MPSPSPSALPLLRQATTLDAAGDEATAIPLYRRALSLGLPSADLHAALIGLGSSLRTTGQTQASIRTLQKARRLFPRDTAITLFLALSHSDADQPDLALRQLANALLSESVQPSLNPYRAVLARKYHALRKVKGSSKSEARNPKRARSSK